MVLAGKRVGFIGAGNMSEAIVRGLVRKITPSDIICSDVNDSRLELFSTLGVRTTKVNQEVVDFCDVLFLAIKPQMARDVLTPLSVADDKMVISILAGTTVQTLVGFLGSKCKVVRVMPNTPCLVGEGACGIFLPPSCTPHDREVVEELCKSVSPVNVFVDREDLIHAVTGVSGSSPAYVFLFIESLVKGGVNEGLSPEDALKLACQAVIGAGKLAAESDVGPDELRRRVCSPGGTTLVALEHLVKGGYDVAVEGCVTACANRSRELAKL